METLAWSTPTRLSRKNGEVRGHRVRSSIGAGRFLSYFDPVYASVSERVLSPAGPASPGLEAAWQQAVNACVRTSLAPSAEHTARGASTPPATFLFLSAVPGRHLCQQASPSPGRLLARRLRPTFCCLGFEMCRLASKRDRM